MQEFLNRENVVRGTLLFIVCTFAGLLISFLWSGSQDITQVFGEMRIEMLFWACLCMFADWFFGALRFHVFIRKVTPTIRFRDSLRANVGTLCVSAITPFQTGGVGHLYIYARAGVPLSGAITSGIICFLSTLITLVLCTAGIIWLDPPFLPEWATWVSLFNFSMLGLVFAAFLVLIFKPEILFRLFHWLCNIAQRRFASLAPALERTVSNVEQLVTEHKMFTAMFLREHKLMCLLSIPLTCGFLGSRIIGSYIVVQALNGDATLWELCVVGLVLNFVVLFAPTPGASGFAESGASKLIENLVSKELKLPFVLLTRFFTVYCAVVVGGIIIGLQVAKDFRKKKRHKLSDSMSH